MRRYLDKFLMAVLIAAGLLLNAAAATAFSDVGQEHEHADAIQHVNSTGLMVGYGDGTFQPDKTVTRAEMATILCKMLGEDKDLKKDGTVFSDVPVSHWGNGYVVKAVELGFVSGYGNGKFGPDDTVTYEQAVTMLVQALGGKEEAAKHGGYPEGPLALAKGHGLLEDISAKTGDPFSRCKVAVLLYNSDHFYFDVAGDNISGGDQMD